VNKLIEGQISFSGVRDALEAALRLGNVKNGVLRITSNEASGMIGIFCGRFITGAVLMLTGQTGQPALIKLLASRDGTFAFLDAGDERLPDLMQSLGIDLQKLVSCSELNEQAVLTEETLTGMVGSPEEIQAIDTTYDIGEVSEAERLTRITRTYEKLLALSYKKPPEKQPELATALTQAQSGAQTPVALPAQPLPGKPSGAKKKETTSKELPPIPPWDIPYTPPAKVEEAPHTTFSRLKRWSAHDDKVGVLIWLSLLVILAVFLWCTWPAIQGLLGGQK
jgi:hypothetical protein